MSACLNCPEPPGWHLTQGPQMETALFVEMTLRKSKVTVQGCPGEEELGPASPAFATSRSGCPGLALAGA